MFSAADLRLVFFLLYRYVEVVVSVAVAVVTAVAVAVVVAVAVAITVAVTIALPLAIINTPTTTTYDNTDLTVAMTVSFPTISDTIEN